MEALRGRCCRGWKWHSELTKHSTGRQSKRGDLSVISCRLLRQWIRTVTIQSFLSYYMLKFFIIKDSETIGGSSIFVWMCWSPAQHMNTEASWVVSRDSPDVAPQASHSHLLQTPRHGASPPFPALVGSCPMYQELFLHLSSFLSCVETFSFIFGFLVALLMVRGIQ